MLNFSKWKIIFVLSICIFSVIFVVPNFYGKSEITALPKFFPKKQFNLGLDLQGGSHLLLEVGVNDVLREKSNDLVDEIRGVLRKEKIKYFQLGSRGIGATVTIRDIQNLPQAKDILNKELGRNIKIDDDNDGKLDFIFIDEQIDEYRNQAVEQSIEVIRKRVDESGTKEPNIQKQGEKRIVVQLPGIKDPGRIKALIGQTAKLNLHLLDPTTVELANQRGKLPPGTFKAQNVNPVAYEKEFVVKKRVLLTGERLRNATATVDPQSGKYVVAF